MGIHQEILLDQNSPNPYSLYIPIINDDCVEYDEYIFVYIVAHPPNEDCVNITDPYVHITIIDDDGKHY